MTDPRPNSEDAALDRLLAAAEWPAVADAATSRLVETLVAERRRPRRVESTRFSAWQIGWATAAGAAAAVLLVAAVANFRSSSSKTPPLAVKPNPSNVAGPNNSVTPLSPPPNAEASTIANRPMERPANAYEQMLLPPRTGMRRSASARTVATNRKPSPASMSKMTVAEATPIPMPDPRAAMREAFTRTRLTPQDTIAAGRLAEIAGPADWPMLRNVLARPAMATAAWPVLLARRDAEAVDLLLSAVLDAQTRPAALDAVRRGPMPPVDRLLACLAGPLVERRLAAAKVLGTACDGGTLPRLAELARTGASRGEALAVLLACNSPAARQWVARVEPDAALTSQADAVRRRINDLFL